MRLMNSFLFASSLLFSMQANAAGSRDFTLQCSEMNGGKTAEVTVRYKNDITHATVTVADPDKKTEKTCSGLANEGSFSNSTEAGKKVTKFLSLTCGFHSRIDFLEKSIYLVTQNQTLPIAQTQDAFECKTQQSRKSGEE